MKRAVEAEESDVESVKAYVRRLLAGGGQRTREESEEARRLDLEAQRRKLLEEG